MLNLNIAQDDRLLHAVLTHGTNWTQIATTHIPTRTTLALKNRFFTLRHRHQSTDTQKDTRHGSALAHSPTTEQSAVRFSVEDPRGIAEPGGTTEASDADDSDQSNDEDGDAIEMGDFSHVDYAAYLEPKTPRTEISTSRLQQYPQIGMMDMSWMENSQFSSAGQLGHLRKSAMSSEQQRMQTQLPTISTTDVLKTAERPVFSGMNDAMSSPNHDPGKLQYNSRAGLSHVEWNEGKSCVLKRRDSR